MSTLRSFKPQLLIATKTFQFTTIHAAPSFRVAGFIYGLAAHQMASQLLNQGMRHVHRHVRQTLCGGKMTMLKKIWSVMLLISMFALAGCPEVSQEGSGGSSGGKSSSSGD
jgi:hypothetical protein